MGAAMEKKKRIDVAFRKSDFSQQALDLGIWDELTEGLGDNVEQVEVSGVRWSS